MNTLQKALAILIWPISATVVSASEIDTIDIRVVLDRSGDAYVQERWKVDVDDSNTEWYLSMKNFGNMVISDFKVYDNDQKYYLSDDSPWNVDRSRYEKAGKCGVKRLYDNDCELCWGVGSSGSHCWTAEYKINGFVKTYNDGCGFNHCFVNHDLSSGPKFTRTTISMADSSLLFPDNARIWAFQYHGTCKFVDGKVVAENTEPLDTDNSMIVMCLFPKEAFNSSNVVNDTIGTMKWTALEGSDYLDNYSDEDYAQGKNVICNETTWWEECIFCLLVIILGGFVYMLGYGLFYLFVAVFLYYGAGLLWNVISLRPLRIFLRRKKLMNGADSKYFRAIPINGDLNRAFHIIDHTNYKILDKDKDDLIAAYIVRLMCHKAISIVSTVEKGKMVNRMKIAKDWNISSVKSDVEADNHCMSLLYNILKKASGENLILEKGELKAYLKKNKNDLEKLEKATLKKNKNDIQPQEYQEVVGLKNYLEDFLSLGDTGVNQVKPLSETDQDPDSSLLLENGENKENLDHSDVENQISTETTTSAETGIVASDNKDYSNDARDAKEKRMLDEYEMKMWDEYLVYATLFGMADKVIKDLNKYCPDYFRVSMIGKQLIDQNGHVVTDFNSFTGISNVSHRLSSSSSSSSSGGGGFSSHGGGGGHSGGGGGGGGR